MEVVVFITSYRFLAEVMLMYELKYSNFNQMLGHSVGMKAVKTVETAKITADVRRTRHGTKEAELFYATVNPFWFLQSSY